MSVKEHFGPTRQPTVSVDLVDHVLKLGLGGVLSQGAHDGSQLLGGDCAITVFVKQGERLLKLWKRVRTSV